MIFSVLGWITYGIAYAAISILHFVKYLASLCCKTDETLISFEADADEEDTTTKVLDQESPPLKDQVGMGKDEKETTTKVLDQESPPLKDQVGMGKDEKETTTKVPEKGFPPLKQEDWIGIGTVILNLANLSAWTLASSETQNNLKKLGRPFRECHAMSVIDYILTQKPKKTGDKALKELVKELPNRCFGSGIWSECLKLIGYGLEKFKSLSTYEQDLKHFAEIRHFDYEKLHTYLQKSDWDGFTRHIFQM